MRGVRLCQAPIVAQARRALLHLLPCDAAVRGPGNPGRDVVQRDAGECCWLSEPPASAPDRSDLGLGIDNGMAWGTSDSDGHGRRDALGGGHES
jgi:hypothetical protein